MAKLTSFVYVLLLLSVHPLVTQAQIAEIIGAVGGAALVTVVPQIALGIAGFLPDGIAAGSLAARVMSRAYSTKKGVGVVSMLQSVGSAGVGVHTVIAGSIAGAGAAYLTRRRACRDTNSCND
ncbi:hypothetical protein BsWGS_24293 [Bradybaena similaris]